MTLDTLWSQQGLLIVQLAIFVVLVVSVIVLIVLWGRGRKEALAELKKTTEALAKQTEAVALTLREETEKRAVDLRIHTEVIAEQVKREALTQAQLTAAELEHKIDTLLSRFDDVATRQKQVKDAVDETKAVVERELVEGDDHTTRAVIDDTHQITEQIKSHLKDEPPLPSEKRPRNGRKAR